MKKFGQVVGITFISQALSFLNAVISPFKGTILVFYEWESAASKTAVAAGFVIVAVIVALSLRASKDYLVKCTIVSIIITAILLVACTVIYFVLKSGFAPSPGFLFQLRDIVWMAIYIVMLVMVGITIAFAQLLLYFGGSGSGRGRGRRQPRASGPTAESRAPARDATAATPIPNADGNHTN
jgi:hypothetical protein